MSRRDWGSSSSMRTGDCFFLSGIPDLAQKVSDPDQALHKTDINYYFVRLIAVHDYERSFPAVLDIYKFW